MPSPYAALDQLIEVLGEEETRSLVELYLEHTSSEIKRIANLPFDKQALVVHALKGSSAQIGAKLFGAQCRAVESQLRETKTSLTHEQLEALLAEFDTAAAPFRAWLRGDAPIKP